MTDRFQTLAARGEAETRVRGSTFHAVAEPAKTETAARDLLARCEKARFDASHHCSAWRIRGGVWRANDAGEPSGSAGAPILAAIDGADVTDCVVVVTRYFGGTKLGVGGLIRAYGEAASHALEAAPRLFGHPAVRVRLSYPYANTGVVMRAIEAAGAHEVDQGYGGGGQEGEVEFTVEASREAEIEAFLRDQSSGALALESVGERVLYTR